MREAAALLAEGGRVRDGRAGRGADTIGFPKPAEFFGLLATGEYTLRRVLRPHDAVL